ncbi:hypothetical protein [Bradyrhizobium sp.]|uniref:hypothetical protein n=1 Tax=Bradyrhizobium sp. TaxID=376 RepID=UPI002D1FBCB3|nr:hypothetical protein [Bradyrhizobium sp.]
MHPDNAGVYPAKPELLILAADCDDTELTGFLKSRVYAKLLTRLILERYQTFNRQVKEVWPTGA